jgi:hypothetical protein
MTRPTKVTHKTVKVGDLDIFYRGYAVECGLRSAGYMEQGVKERARPRPRPPGP